MRRMVPTVALLLLLAGCGSYRWEKAGAGPEDFRRDSASCEQQGSAAQWDACMRGLGWHYANRAFW